MVRATVLEDRMMKTLRKTGRGRWTCISGIAVLFVLTVMLGTPAWGKVALEDHVDPGEKAGRPGAVVKTPHGYGWRAAVPANDTKSLVFLKYPISGNVNPAAGTIEMEIIRGATSDIETLFALVGEDGRKFITADIHWKGVERKGGAELRFEISHGQDMLWYRDSVYVTRSGQKTPIKDPVVPLRKSVPVDGNAHLVFSWGPEPAQCSIFLDGKKLAAKVASPFGMTRAISEATWLIVGANPQTKWKGADYHLNSTLEYVRLHDYAVDGGELFAEPNRFSPGGAVAVSAFGHDAAQVAGFSGTLVAGDTVTVSLEGTAGSEAVFDVGRLADRRGEIGLSWKGWGVYLEDITFFEDDQVDLRDVEEYRVYASKEPIDTGSISRESPFVEALDVEEQSYILDKVTVPVEGGEYETEFLEYDIPYYVAVMALMDDDTFLPVVLPKQGISMAEVEGAPGTYEGSFTVAYKDVYPEAVIVARLGSGEGAVSMVSEDTFVIDARLNLDVYVSEQELKADEKSTSEITVTVTDANADEVPDHEIRFLLATTSQYTGVVGGGAFADEVGGTLELDFRGVTDMFGRVNATYTAGFAAKTAIIVARDMMSDDTGAGYVKTYINATAELELEAVTVSAGKSLGYAITVTSSDEWLTADGESEARITALVTKDGIPVEGHRVGFTVASGTGRIRTVKGETGSDGKARAIYTAGKKIGIVLIRATDHTIKISGTVQIELRSDAPAKIAITLSEEVLPADGRSTADIAVLVTDINDNPNEGVEVEYVVAIGDGRIRDIEEVTDRDGESTAEYVAGTIPGRISIEVTVRSTVPTEEELLAARDLATAVLDYDFY
jgi:hypothetical protein